MAKITYEDKVGITPKTVHINQVWDDDMNDIKNAINEIDDNVNSILSGGANPIEVSAIWQSGFTFDCTAKNYPINNTFYSAPDTTVVLSGSDATLDRIDLIVAKIPVNPSEVGTIQVIEGDLSTTELVVPKDYDRSVYYVIKKVIVKAGESSPDGVITETVWSENAGSPTEWDFSGFYLSVEVDTNETHSGTYSIESSNQLVGERIDLTRDSVMSTTDIGVFSFWVKLKADFGDSYVYIKFYNGLGTVGDLYAFKNGENGFDSSNLDWQKISIPQSKFNLPIFEFDKIRIFFYKSFLGFYADDFTMNTGSGNEGSELPNGIEEAPDEGKWLRENKSWSEYNVPTLQEVTEESNEITNSIIINDDRSYFKVINGINNSTITENSLIIESNDVPPFYKKIGFLNNTNLGTLDSPIIYYILNGYQLSIKTSLLTSNRSVYFTNVDGTLLTLSDTLTAPTSSTDNGVKGEVRIVGGYRYECIDTDTWVRSTVTTSF